jgi:hypothetical protein
MVTAVNAENRESGYSKEVKVVIPNPWEKSLVAGRSSFASRLRLFILLSPPH